jgi:predicted permease
VSGGGRRRRGIDWLRRGEARLRADVDEELGFHLEMRTRELVATGMSAAAARAQAVREFGDVEETRRHLVVRDRAQETRRGRLELMQGLRQDIRFGVRGLLRDRAFTLVALVMLALGIGANAAIFSVVDTVLIRALPYQQPDRLVAVWPRSAFLRAEYDMARARTRSFAALAAFEPGVDVSFAAARDAQRLTAARITANLLPALGVSPVGGGFVAADEQGARGDVALISHRLWRAHFGARSMAGQGIVLDGRSHIVVGILPAGFAFPDAETDVWLPLPLEATQVGRYWGVGGTRSIARLRAGASAVQAQSELRTLAEEMRLANPLWTPKAPYRADATVEPLQASLVGATQRMLLVLLGAVGLVLLIACANVGNLFLARGLARERELAVRRALGAGRGRIVRQLLTESAVLSLAGGALGLGLAWIALRALVRLLPPSMPRLSEVHIDVRVLGFTLLASVLTGLVFGTLPALRIASSQLSASLKDGARAGTSVSRRRLSSGLVIAEVALAVILVTGAGLLVRSLHNLSRVAPGFAHQHMLTARLDLPVSAYPEPARRLVFYERVAQRLRAFPGVSSVAITNQMPFDGELSITAAAIEFVTNDPNELPVFWYWSTTPDYFTTMQIPLLEGRAFTDTDRAHGAPVAIVDATTAQRFWPGQSALGKRIGRPWLREWRTVVGVVGPVRSTNLTRTIDPAFYVPFAQDPAAAAVLVVRSAAPIDALSAAIRAAVRAADPIVAVSEIRTAQSLIAGSATRERATSVLVGTLAALALLLGATGLYGLLSYSVTQRKHELALRSALGASRASLLRIVLHNGLALTATGLMVGVPAAWLLAHALRGLLFGIEPGDAGNLIAVTLVLSAASLLAALIPALRALRVQPAEALKGMGR